MYSSLNVEYIVVITFTFIFNPNYLAKIGLGLFNMENKLSSFFAESGTIIQECQLWYCVLLYLAEIFCLLTFWLNLLMTKWELFNLKSRQLVWNPPARVLPLYVPSGRSYKENNILGMLALGNTLISPYNLHITWQLSCFTLMYFI